MCWRRRRAHCCMLLARTTSTELNRRPAERARDADNKRGRFAVALLSRSALICTRRRLPPTTDLIWAPELRWLRQNSVLVVRPRFGQFWSADHRSRSEILGRLLLVSQICCATFSEDRHRQIWRRIALKLLLNHRKGETWDLICLIISSTHERKSQPSDFCYVINKAKLTKMDVWLAFIVNCLRRSGMVRTCFACHYRWNWKTTALDPRWRPDRTRYNHC